MTSLKRKHLKKDIYKEETSEQWQFWKGQIWTTTRLERKNQKNDDSERGIQTNNNFEQEKSEKGQFWKGNFWKGQFWKGKIEKGLIWKGKLWKMTIMKRKQLEKGNSEKENRKGQFWKWQI